MTHDRPPIEWIFGALSAAIVACLLLFLFYRAISADIAAEDLAVAVEHIDARADATVVQVRLINGGPSAVSAVSVQAVSEDGSFETKEITFDHVAANSIRRGIFILPPAASGDALRLEVGGYVFP